MAEIHFPTNEDDEDAYRGLPLKHYNCTIRLMDTGLPYRSLEEAKKETQEWAQGIADEENCMVVDIEVMEDVSGSED